MQKANELRGDFRVKLLLQSLSFFRSVRMVAAEQFLLIATKVSSSHNIMIFFITLLFTVLHSSVKECAEQSQEYFQVKFNLHYTS